MNRRLLIIGGGVAACEAAVAARKNASEASVTIIAAENFPPYRRPALPDTLLREPSESFWLKSADFYRDNRIEIHLNDPAAKIDVPGRKVLTGRGETFSFDRLCIASGANPRIPAVPGTELNGVFASRTMDEYRAIGRMVTPDMPVVVIGGGVQGLELAWVLFQRGAAVTVVEYAPRLLSRQLSETGSRVLAGIIADACGERVSVRCGASLGGFKGAGGVLEAAVTAEGGEIPCRAAVISAGIVPETGLAAQAGLPVSPRGITVGADCRVAGFDDIFACGDCAAPEGFNAGLFSAARRQGQVAGANMAGGSERYARVPEPVRLVSFGTRLLAVGTVDAPDMEERVSDDGKSMRGMYFRDGRCVGAVLLGDLTGQAAAAEAVNTGAERNSALKAGGWL